MSECFVQAAKFGDIISLLPLLSYRAEKNREPVNLVVSKQYCDAVYNLDYIKADIVDDHWQNLEFFLKYAKRKYDKVYCTQTYGKTVAIEHRYPSFQHDQWARAKSLWLFDKLPLIIPRPTYAKELVKNHLGEVRTILFADQGESSQFGHADDLYSSLVSEFGKTHKVVRLSAIRLEHFTDFVSLYDSAEAIIVTETAHLHLSKATRKPVFALVTDTPTRWHGSAWSKQFKLHIRYSQYQRRKQELIEGIRSVL